MRSERRQAHSAAFRGALWITLIALVTTGLALTLQYVQTVRLLEVRMHALVEDEATSLVDRYQREGLAGVSEAIQRQQRLPRINEFFYLLADPDGAPIAGNLVVWPAEVATPGFQSFTTDVTNTRGVISRRRVEARAILLEDRYRLLVGDFADERALLRERYLRALFLSFAATGLLGLVLGLWYSRRGLSFVDEVTRTGQRFLAGRLDQRLPIAGRGDEYDRLAATINRCFDEVERLVGSLRAATDGLAHDLKTPLTRIRARIELSALGEPSREALFGVVEDIRTDLDALLRLIEETLNLARAEAAETAGFVPVRIDEIAAETIELYQPLADEKNLRLEADLTPAVLAGSRTLLAQLIANLIDNAIKYTDEGGIRVAVRRDAESVHLIVSDSGIGIPPEQRDKALMRFQRLDQSRSTSGSGIGLSIVDVVARVHDARLELLDNAPGLRVEVTFPAPETSTGQQQLHPRLERGAKAHGER